MPPAPSRRSMTLPGYDPVNIQPWAYSVVIAMFVLAVAVTCLRILSRRLLKQGLWWDDWCILFSQIWMCFTVAGFLMMLKLGVGLHIDALGANATDLPKTLAIVVVVTNCFYFWNLAVTKISVLLLYVRVFRLQSYLRIAAWAMGGVVVAWAITVTFLTCFSCVPAQKMWDTQLPGHCVDKVAVRGVNALMTITTDVIILVLPIHQVCKLQMRIGQKVAVLFAFSLGSFVVFTSMYRIRVVLLQSPSDPSYSVAPAMGWTAIEISASLISASLPTLGPLVQELLTLVGAKKPRGVPTTGDASGKANSRVVSSPHRRRSGGGGGGVVSGPPGRSNSFYEIPDSPIDSPVAKERPAGDKYYSSELGTGGELFRTRPAHGFSRASIISANGGNARAEIPLHGIYVKKEFVQSSQITVIDPLVAPGVWKYTGSPRRIV